MCEASNHRTWHRGCANVISSKHCFPTNRSNRPCRHNIGQVIWRSRFRLSTRSTSEARVRIISRGNLASNLLRRSLSSGVPVEPRSAASTSLVGIHLKSSTCAKGANSEGIGCLAKLDAKISPATRDSVAAISIAIGPENDSPRIANRPLGVRSATNAIRSP